MRYYIAYGSNLNVAQMKWRCPGAKIVGTAIMEGWELLFKGSKTGSYLTIERKEGSRVPVAVWSVSETDEAALDRYEGYPTFYYKLEDVELDCVTEKGRQRKLKAFVYIMHEERPLGVPSESYMHVCRMGYERFGFDDEYLFEAFRKSARGVLEEAV